MTDAIREGKEPPIDKGGRPPNPARDVEAIVALTMEAALSAKTKEDFYQAFMPLATQQLAAILTHPNKEIVFKGVKLVQEQTFGKPSQTIVTNNQGSTAAREALSQSEMADVASIGLEPRKEPLSGNAEDPDHQPRKRPGQARPHVDPDQNRTVRKKRP